MDLLLQLISLFSVLSVLVSYCYTSRKTHPRRIPEKDPQAPPEPAGGLPLLGHLHLLDGSTPMAHTVASIADQYGPAFILRLGLHRALFVSSWELAKDCFTTNDLAMATRPQSVAGEHIAYNYAMLAFSPYGPYWRQIRKIVTVEVLSARQLDSLSRIFLAETDMGVKGLHRECMKQGGGKLVVEMRRWFGDLSFNVLTMILAGKRYFGTCGISDEKEARQFQRVMERVIYLTGLFHISDALPFVSWMDWGKKREIKRAMDELDSLMAGWLADHRRKREAGEMDGGDRDFVDVMLSILEQEPLANYDIDTVIKATALTLIIAGTDTSTITLSWAVSELLNNRPMLKKALDELDMQVGMNRLVEDSDTKKLVYLQAIIKETMRLHPAAPLLLPHEASVDCYVGGFHILPGTRLFVNVWKMHRDPRIWSEPTEFRPERFITSHADMDVRGQHFQYLPFGSGRRACPGVTFALRMMHLNLARLLQAFDLDTPNGEPVDMTEGLGLTMHRATPLEVVLTPRLPSHLYQ
ncbi:hypothetical protein ACLOJK_002971 [Asimina triloba]